MLPNKGSGQEAGGRKYIFCPLRQGINPLNLFMGIPPAFCLLKNFYVLDPMFMVSAAYKLKFTGYNDISVHAVLIVSSLAQAQRDLWLKSITNLSQHPSVLRIS